MAVEEQVISLANDTIIPVVISTTTNWNQYIVSLVITSLVTFYIAYKLILQPLEIHTLVGRIWYKLKVKVPAIIINSKSQGIFDIGMIDGRTYQNLARKMQHLGGKPFDLILHTPGGSMFFAMIISRLLRSYPGRIRAIVPTYAMSAGTMLALSCNKIYMNDYATLGPVDPQIGTFWKFGPVAAWEKLKQFKGKKMADDSYVYSHLSKQANDETRAFFKDLLKDHTANPDALDYFVKGDLLHSHQFTKNDLRLMGIQVGNIPYSINKILYKMLGRPVD